MPRPEIVGLKYCPLDVGFYRDKKIRLLRGEHGAQSIEIYQRLMLKCYEENGYFLDWDSDSDYALMADETGYSEEKIRLIISTCIKRSLFNDKLFNVGNVLTSRGIQWRYFSAIRDTRIKAAAQGRYTFIKNDMCLLSDEDFSELNKTYVWLKVANNSDNSGINYNKSGINYNKSEINPPKESKVKESKVKESKVKEAVSVIPEKIKEEWDSFVEMRKEIKRPLTNKAILLALRKLQDLAPNNFDLQKEILNQSTFNCWQGLFPIGGENRKTTKTIMPDYSDPERYAGIKSDFEAFGVYDE